MPFLAVSLAARARRPFPAGAQQIDPANPGNSSDQEKTQEEPPEEPFEPDLEQVVLQGLDKETARILTFGGPGRRRLCGSGPWTSRYAVASATPPHEPPERAAFLQIYDIDPETGETDDGVQRLDVQIQARTLGDGSPDLRRLGEGLQIALE